MVRSGYKPRSSEVKFVVFPLLTHYTGLLPLKHQWRERNLKGVVFFKKRLVNEAGKLFVMEMSCL